MLFLALNRTTNIYCSKQILLYSKTVSRQCRHTVVCFVTQEAGVPHCEYIDRKKENVIFTYVTQSGKTGLIAYLKVSRNADFKDLVCCSSPMVEAMCTRFSHVLHQFLTFQSIHCASSLQLSFLPF